MIWFKDGNLLFYLYPKEVMSASVFSNYTIFGWILFLLVGVFGLISIGCTIARIRNYGYFIIVEGIFASFFTIINFAYTEFAPVHAILLPICFVTILLGVLQTPKEF